jgi:aryl-alcohol dehydrogenase-like predicted oxidoreductase
MGILPVKSGSMTMEGAELSKLHSYERVAKGLAYVPQGRMIFSTMTVKENIETGLVVSGERNVPEDIYELFPVLLEMKQAQKVRYVGVTTSTDDQYPQLKNAIAKLPLDFIQVDYSIDNRGAADEILPMARDKGLAVLINVPLGGRRGNVLSRLAGKPLPAYAAEVDATSWAQLLLKYNVSHPAVTAVIPGTTKLSHLEDNQRAGRGRLPDAAMRTQLEEFWATV